MTNAIDNAIARIQDISLALTSVTIKSALDYPVENEEPFPCSVTYLGSGEFMLTNATIHHNFPALKVEFHFSRVNLKKASQDINAVALEFPKRIAGDPTLNGTIDTVVGGAGRPIPYEVRPFIWREKTDTAPALRTQALIFTIPLKTLQAPTSTA